MGNWENELNAEQVSEITSKNEALMEKYQYIKRK